MEGLTEQDLAAYEALRAAGTRCDYCGGAAEHCDPVVGCGWPNAEHLRPNAADVRYEAEVRRLTGPELGFPLALAATLAERAETRGWLPVANPLLPAGPDNVQVQR